MQQVSSNEQTIEQHFASLQNGLACSLQQLPAAASPQLRPPPQSVQACAASAAQIESHAVWQQRASIWQTASQQAWSLQLAFSCGKQQLPASGVPQGGSGQTVSQAGFTRAVEAQKASHALVQQKMSTRQTASQQTRSLHHGVGWGWQQSPAQTSPHLNW